jgi:hypothetical protein
MEVNVSAPDINVTLAKKDKQSTNLTFSLYEACILYQECICMPEIRHTYRREASRASQALEK